MSAAETHTEEPQAERPLASEYRVPRDKKIISVCAHGSSRSKYIAREIGRMGYTHSRLLGLQDSDLSRDEKIATLLQHEIIVCATGTEAATVSRLLVQIPKEKWPQFIELSVSEQIHAQVHQLLKGVQLPGEDPLQELKKMLLDNGFQDFSTVQTASHT